jgi:hypothetical protein
MFWKWQQATGELLIFKRDDNEMSGFGDMYNIDSKQL